MLEQGFIKQNFVGTEGFQWWIGQVAPEETWKDNIPAAPQRSNSDIMGFGERYKVRIMGYHTANVDDLPDEQLPWASVMYPVTAGGGGRGSYANANITQGTFVFGFFIDGTNCQQPVIMGCLGYNEYNKVMKNPTGLGNTTLPSFGARTGYIPAETKISPAGTKVIPGGIQAESSNIGNRPVVNEYSSEGIGAGKNNQEMASFVAKETDTPKDPLPATSKCEPMPVGKMQRQLQNILQEVEKVRRAQTDYRYSVTMASGNEQAKIDSLVQKAAKFVAGSMKYVYGEIEKSVLNSVNKGIKQISNNLMPNEQHTLKGRVDSVNDIIACLFKRLTEGLFSMAFNFLSQMVTRAVNITRCFVDQFIGRILGQMMGTIDGIVQGAVGGLRAMMALGAGLSGSIPNLNISTNVTALIADVLSFLTCEEDPECSDVKDWSILGGAGSLASTDISSILGTMGSVATQAAADLAGQAAAGVGLPVPSASDLDSLSIDFSSVSGQNCMDGSSSSTDPVSCGPPLVSFLGGQGSTPPVGNALISAAGSVLGVDLIRFGFNVNSNMSISINDTCGSGNGAVVTPVFGDVSFWRATDESTNSNPPTNPDDWERITDDYAGVSTSATAWRPTTNYEVGDIVQTATNGTSNPTSPVNGTMGNGIGAGGTIGSLTGIVAVNVTRGGVDYLPGPDGSTGGDGRTWARPDDTSIIREDGVREIPRAPGNVMSVTPGDQVLLPPGTSVTLEPSGEQIIGGSNQRVTTEGSFTTPVGLGTTTRGGYPSGDGSYPVVLSIDKINIMGPGISYKSGDRVVINPDRGATAEIDVNNMGNITAVRVTSPGEGFQEIPQVYVESDTGFNGELNPRFRIDRVSDDEIASPQLQDKIVSVVDCVGVVPDSLYAPCKNCTDTSMVW